MVKKSDRPIGLVSGCSHCLRKQPLGKHFLIELGEALGSIAVLEAADVLLTVGNALLAAWDSEENLLDGMSHSLLVVRVDVDAVGSSGFL